MTKQWSISEKVDFLMSRVEYLEKENSALRTKVDGLTERLSKYETPKNSSNSNKPPSGDFPKLLKTNSLRGGSENKPGGQPGRKGNTLKMVESPDIIEKHQSNYCIKCGKDISLLPSELIGKRQVIDIPPIQSIVTEHRVYKRVCSCGHCNESAFPEGVHTPVSYGAGVQSMVAYLNARHYVPIGRSAEFLNSIFKISISTGGICYLLNKTKQKALPVYEAIRQFVLNQTVVGGDETGVNINGKNNWAWAFQNPMATFIAIHESRGSRAINDIMPEGFNKNILVTDCWSAYFKTGALSHQLCTAHLQRELKYFNQIYPENTWVNRLAALIENSLDLLKNNKLTTIKINEIRRTFSLLIEEPATTKKIKELIAFQNRMVKYEDYVFGFLDYPNLPPDNNGSERAIRNFKIKLKNSGFFKSFEGATIYAVIRSIIDTAIKNEQNPYRALQLLALNVHPTE